MIPITKPFLGEEEAALARQAILSGWVTQGPKVKQFEEAFAAYVGSKYACATSNCTTALHLALLAVGVKPGDVVITVSHSFIATANCVRHCGGEPVFMDIDLKTCNLSVKSLEQFLEEKCVCRQGQLFYKDVLKLAGGESPLKYFVDRKKDSSEALGRVAAILTVHQLGMPCDLKNILALSRKFQVPVVEDAAYAIGSEVSLDDGKSFGKVGKPHGDMACFSFHPRKVLVTGEGGMLTTNNEQLDAQVRLLRHQGMGTSDLVRHKSNKVIFETYDVTGYNYRMSDIQASIGIEQLKKIPAMLERRRQIAQMYAIGLKDISWMEVFSEPSDAKYNWASYLVRILDHAPKSRDELMQYLLDQGVSTRPGVMNAHRETPYQNYAWHLPESEKARDSIILLPSFHEIKDEEFDALVSSWTENQTVEINQKAYDRYDVKKFAETEAEAE
ncbi:MAG: DegT/DnrJ/EryC1/StrS family aminotransferase [Candidatus Omnitrophota bacterium]